ncbi:hypothetical protein [Sphingopyxis sp. 113P3]|uniref:hypothetical protein n=1 Tax=Sphingopyxis sp. (strain 113P3) TaxID=292913 RepID=UPI000ABFA2BD|nr:hypothetical protein [Sphingopyxis sp. 113P3]
MLSRPFFIFMARQLPPMGVIGSRLRFHSIAGLFYLVPLRSLPVRRSANVSARLVDPGFRRFSGVCLVIDRAELLHLAGVATTAIEASFSQASPMRALAK